MIAGLCKKYDCICISDEVYEWMIYDDNKHIKIGKKIVLILIHLFSFGVRKNLYSFEYMILWFS